MFGRAIHALSKIGEELYIEPLAHGVCTTFQDQKRNDNWAAFKIEAAKKALLMNQILKHILTYLLRLDF